MPMERMTVAVEWKSIKDCGDDIPAEWKAKADDPNVLVGYLSTFNNVDLGGDVVRPGAFDKAVTAVKAEGIPLLADHMAMTSSVLGTISDAKVDRKGLIIFADISAAPSAQDTAVKLREGHLSKMSMGYEAMDYKFTDLEDGRRVRELLEVKLWEGSVVVFPMNPEAVVTGMKALTLAAAEAGVTPEDLATATEVKVSDDHPGLPHVSTLDAWRIMLAVERKTGVPSGETGTGTSEATPAGSESKSGDKPGEDSGTSSAGWDPYRSAAMLAGRETGDVDPAERAGLSTRLELAEAALNPTTT